MLRDLILAVQLRRLPKMSETSLKITPAAETSANFPYPADSGSLGRKQNKRTYMAPQSRN